MVKVNCLNPIAKAGMSLLPARTSSFTPFAFAPGVLNTTIPFSAHFSRGILLTPAPALATAVRRQKIVNISFIRNLHKISQPIERFQIADRE